MERELTFYEKLVQASQDYLGPATERFLDRQISTHLDKQPTELAPEDLTKLIEWIKLAFALLTSDEALLREYSKRLESLAK